MSKKTNTGKQNLIIMLKSFGIILRSALKVVFSVLLLVLCICAGLLIGVVAGCIITTSEIEDPQIYLSGFSSHIYDVDGNEIATLKGYENINRTWVDIEQVPKPLLDAFIAIEDERFYTHPGVDVKRTVSAFLGYFLPGMASHGGSTITQQVIKNITGEWDQSVPRKIREIWRALQFEKKYDKNEILELYINIIYMSQDIYGVYTASYAFFDKHVSELSIAECAFLAGITNNPSRYNPFTTTGRANCYKRQINILDKMLELGSITEEEYREAIQTELVFNEDYRKNSSSAQYSYFVETVIKDVRQAFIDEGYTLEEANNLIYNGGITIQTTQDPHIQKIVDEEFNNIENFPMNHIYTDTDDMAQAAITIMDQSTGQIVAIYGGYGPKEGNLGFNFATDAKRQPGSAIKPLLVYAPLIDQHILTSASVFEDIPSYLDDSRPNIVWPTNVDGKFHGLVSLRESLAHSYNIPAVSLYKLHTQECLDYLKRAGIDRPNETQAAAALGGFTEGVSTLEMTAAYVPFANNGTYYDPVTFTKIYDRDGKLILDNTPKATIVYEDYRTAYIMTSLLTEVVTTGTGTKAQIYNKDNVMIPTAGKTGTTTNNVDFWFAGYTPYYTAAVWYGYDDQTEISNVESGAALKLWNVIMERIHADIENPKSFNENTGIISCEVCQLSGKRPNDVCYSMGHVSTELFIAGTQPASTDICSIHVKVPVCTHDVDFLGKNYLASPDCEECISIVEGVLRPIRQDILDVLYNKVVPEDERFETFVIEDWDLELSHEYCPYHLPSLEDHIPLE